MAICACVAPGSSPRAGRRRRAQRRVRASRGLIPAGGEATCPWTSRTRCTRAHPRGRGGDAIAEARHSAPVGSSPRAGRRPGRAQRGPLSRGLIPAGGEATRRGARPATAPRAHPRGRGGDCLALRSSSLTGGSSPRAGRRLADRGPSRRGDGLIPAGGEATPTSSPTPSTTRAHPRGRGGDASRSRATACVTGSSPRAGRRQGRGGDAAHQPGLIPAGGEATRCRSATSTWMRAHPRGRGGDVPVSDATTGAGGSSPRAGRRHDGQLVGRDVLGLIPAGGEAT